MDITLNYREKGEGEVLVLLHGNGESSDDFSSQLEYFSRFYRVIAPDTRGHGMSERGTAPFTLEQFASDLYDFLVSLKIDKAHILGFSDGANIAIIFALRHPGMVDKLILNSPNIYVSGCKKSLLEWVRREYEDAEKRGDEKTKAMMALMMSDYGVDMKKLKSITRPTLVIAGTDDMILRSHTRDIASHIPSSKLVFIEGDHFIAYKKSDEFNSTVFDFLQRG